MKMYKHEFIDKIYYIRESVQIQLTNKLIKLYNILYNNPIEILPQIETLLMISCTVCIKDGKILRCVDDLENTLDNFYEIKNKICYHL